MATSMGRESRQFEERKKNGQEEKKRTTFVVGTGAKMDNKDGTALAKLLLSMYLLLGLQCPLLRRLLKGVLSIWLVSKVWRLAALLRRDLTLGKLSLSAGGFRSTILTLKELYNLHLGSLAGPSFLSFVFCSF